MLKQKQAAAEPHGGLFSPTSYAIIMEEVRFSWEKTPKFPKIHCFLK